MDLERYGCARIGRMTRWQVVWILAAIQVFGFVPQSAAEPQKSEKRPVTEEDAIRMVRIAGTGSINSYAGTLTENFTYFSPDEQRFVFVLKKGNLQRNTNDYSLLLFKTSEAFASPKPRVLAALSSSSNREAITDVTWLSDNDTILFRGEDPGESSQLYSVSATSGVLRKLTSHPTNLVEFSSDALGHTVVYAAERPKPKVLTEKSAREGVVIANEDMSELLMGARTDETRDLFVLNAKSGETRPLPIPAELRGALSGNYLHFSLSPDATQFVARLNLLEVTHSWRDYRQPLLTRIMDRTLPKNALTWMFRYAVIDTASGAGRVLLNGPVSYYGSEVVWGDDSKSVVLTGVLLPLDVAAGNLKRLTNPAVVAVDVESLAFEVLSEDDLRFVRRESKEAVFTFETRASTGTDSSREFHYSPASGPHWTKHETGTSTGPGLTITAKQDLNTPPKIMVSNSRVARKATLLDLNPQFRELELGHVEEISFVGAEHKSVNAGLYFPVGYVAGQKYPLVVQTHGFDPKSFWVDGSFTTAFAAQALAGRGFLVLQVPDIHDWDETPAEAPNMMETLERAVEYVDSLGCLDRGRLGITGFSRTGFYVQYMLEHSKLHFGAAIVADGSDGGYSQYLQFLNAHSFTASDSEMLNGGMPFGSTLLFWLRRSPEFSLDLLKTPLMLQSNTPEFLATMWAPFVGLKRLGVPVELLFFPTGTHIMEKPWDRLVSQGAAVDWFAFWLNQGKSADAGHADRYGRWETLRGLQMEGSLDPPALPQ
jgi:dipeptidyl aminopeptidase/acylaminoacyl peptidase